MISPFFRKKGTVDAKENQSAEPGEAQLLVTPGSLAGEAEEEIPVESVLASRSGMDKKSLDLIFAVEQMIQAKQHSELQISETQDRLAHANGHIERLNRDMKHLSRVVEEREKSILDLEQKMIEKNMKMDAVAEEYREMQRKLATEIEELKSVIDLEKQKYGSLLAKHNEGLAEKNKRILELEERISRQEAENQHLKQKYESTHQEKVYLSNMISDFTSRMATPIGREG